MKDDPQRAWSWKAVFKYNCLVQDRLTRAECQACRASLESSRLIRTETTIGIELNEYELSDVGAATFLAETDNLLVACSHCGAHEWLHPDAAASPAVRRGSHRYGN